MHTVCSFLPGTSEKGTLQLYNFLALPLASPAVKYLSRQSIHVGTHAADLAGISPSSPPAQGINVSDPLLQKHLGTSLTDPHWPRVDEALSLLL